MAAVECEAGSVHAAADTACHSSVDCFNCRHTVQLPLSLSSTVLCDNCGLPLRLPAPVKEEAVEASSLHLDLLLDPCGVCGESLSAGSLSFLPCGHLIHDRHRLVYRHCTRCAPHLPPYSHTDRLHSPTAEEAEHYRRRKEAERARYGDEKGPCLPLFLQPGEVVHLLVYGEEEAVELSRSAMEDRIVDLQRETREKQRELERQRAEEADTVQAVESQRTRLEERQDSLARRRERTDHKRRRAEEARMEGYARSRGCNAVERDVSSLTQHIGRHCEADQEALREADEALFGTPADDESDVSSAREQRAEWEQRKRTTAVPHSDSEAVQVQLRALHIRYTHLHNSRIRQSERAERAHETLSTQYSTSEAAMRAVAEECSKWANQLATVQCEVRDIYDERLQATRKRADSPSETGRVGPQQPANTATGGSIQSKGLVNTLSVSPLSVVPSVSHTPTARSLAVRSRSHSVASVLSSAVPFRSSALSSVSARLPCVSSSPAASVSHSSLSSSSCRRFPSFTSLSSVVVGRGRVLVDGSGGGGAVVRASGELVRAAAVASTGRVRGKRATDEANKGAINRFVQPVKR